MTRTERLLRLARLRGDRAAELIVIGNGALLGTLPAREMSAKAIRDGLNAIHLEMQRREIGVREWTEAELRAAWGDR